MSSFSALRPLRQCARQLVVGAALASLTACAPGYHPTPYWQLRETAFHHFQPGVTTRQDVLNQIGQPLSTMEFARQREEVWDYRYLEGSTRVMLAHVHFDENGVFKYLEQILDPAYQGTNDAGSR
jgi:outer membrane protein assembly factor BamE (lipoprotein component of BamABCDE complex)